MSCQAHQNQHRLSIIAEGCDNTEEHAYVETRDDIRRVISLNLKAHVLRALPEAYTASPALPGDRARWWKTAESDTKYIESACLETPSRQISRGDPKACCYCRTSFHCPQPRCHVHANRRRDLFGMPTAFILVWQAQSGVWQRQAGRSTKSEVNW